MKKQFSLIISLFLASSAFTACEDNNEKSQYKEAISEAFDSLNDLDREKMYKTMFPKEIQELHEKLGDYTVTEEEKAEFLRTYAKYTIKDVNEKEPMTESQLSLIEKYLAEEKFGLEYMLLSETQTLPDSYYMDGVKNVKPFCDVTKGYLVTIKVDKNYDKDATSPYNHEKLEDESYEADLYVFYIDGDGWKVDQYNFVDTYIKSAEANETTE